MQNNYDRLFEELTYLLEDQDVIDNLDKNLKPRIDRLMSQKGKSYVNQKIKQMAKEDTQSLFGKPYINDMSKKFEQIVLKQRNIHNSLNQRENVHTSANKHIKPYLTKTSIIKNQDRPMSNSKRMLTSKSRQKSNKNMITYSTQLLNRSKSRERSNSKYGMNQNNLKQSKKLSCFVNDKKIKKPSFVQKVNHETSEIIPHKSSKNEATIRKSDSQCRLSEKYLQKKHSKLSNVSDSKEVIKRLAILETEPARLSLNDSKFYRQNIVEGFLSKQNTDVFEIIGSQQQEIDMQKRSLQEAVRKLRERIQEEKLELQQTNTSILKMQKTIQKIQSSKNDSCFEFKLSRKKSQNYYSQAKSIGRKLVQTNKTNQFLLGNINQEKYLIDMYETVIDQMKNQLKIEQQEKIQLKKRLVLTKNCQKMMLQKYTMKQALNNQIFESMQESLKKWR